VAGAKRNGKRRRAAKAAEGPRSSAPPAEAAPVASPLGTRARYALMAIAVFYLGTVWLDGVGSTAPARWLPRPWVYFAQVAALFKNAGLMAIDYRAEGWVCADKKWVEVDVRPFFLVDQDNKENRFHRTLQFYRRERKVMRALEDYVLKSLNASASSKIGGVRFLSLRLPYPKPGEHVERYERKPLSAYPAEMRKAWYWTPRSRRIEHCGPDVPADPETEGKTPADDEKKPQTADPAKEPEP
jgi:hypothetical protein